MIPLTRIPLAGSYAGVLAVPAVRLLWLAQLVSILGDFLAIFAIFSIVTFRLGGDAGDVSLVLVASLLPLTVVAPIAGVFVDRWDLKRTLIGSDVIRAALCLLLLWAQSAWQIYAVLLAISTVSTFFSAAHAVTVRTITPAGRLINVNALMQQAFYTMQIAGPAAAGVLVARFGPGVCFWMDGVSYAVSALLVARVTIDRAPDLHRNGQVPPRTVSAVIADMRTGIGFILSHPVVRIVVAATAVGMFAMRCFGALLALYVRDVLHDGPQTFGALSSLIGVGMIVGNLFVHRSGAGRSRASAVLYGVLGTGVAIVMVAAIPSRTMAVAGITVLGVCFAFLVTPSQTLIQEDAPRDLLGRVMGGMSAVLMGAQVVGLSLAGPAGQVVGTRNLYFACAGLLVVAFVAGRVRLARVPDRRSGEARA
jgi:DHA3 family macrolide efflux protein-like MFS transporter